VILWKQYSGRKFSGFFTMISDWFLSESTGSWQESTGKNPDNFGPEYCFHVPSISSELTENESGAEEKTPRLYSYSTSRIQRQKMSCL
jgi:hypothetical protein